MILLYHRVADVEFDPQLLCVSPRHFSEHLQVLAAEAKPLSLSELVVVQSNRRLPHNAVVVTFDDGYADNLYEVGPVLEKRGVRATVFVSTGSLDAGVGYWWDRLEWLLLRPGLLPAVLEIRLADRTLRWELGEAARYEEVEFQQWRGWNVLAGDDPTPRHAAYRELHRLLRQCSPSEHQSALAQIEACHQPCAHAEKPPRGLTADELVRLVGHGLVEVGAHSVTHPKLAGLTLAEQRREIQQGKERLEAILGREVTSFAYPFGSSDDYTPDTVALVRYAGFSCACANVAGVVRQTSNVFELPRMIVRDWGGDEFASRLEEWFLG